jgi:hypothetical protein
MRRHACCVPLVAMLLAALPAAAVKVKVESGRTYDLTRARTWAWNPEGAGEVKVARTADDDAEAARQIAEPVIMAAVAAAMDKRGRRLTPDAPDVVLTYYLLLTTSATSQSLGQFLPGVAQWAVPPFNAATQSLEVRNEGGLLLYLRAKDVVVWRGFAQARIDTSATAAQRDTLLRDAISDLLRRLPRARD